ncbi:MAG TPA: hypothetical protein VFY93_02310 [Planctomycetota bacterium]|nr:hypothetical protein [Planctomycetota bacterium]
MSFVHIALRALALTALLSAGCASEYTYTLNPDGSGRVDFEWKVPNAGYRDTREAEAQITRSSKVDAWEHVTIKHDAAGTSTFRATAYFKDVNARPLAGMSNFYVELRDNGDGTKTLRVLHSRQGDFRPKQAMPEEKIRERMAKVRDDYLQQLQDPKNDRNRKGRYTLIIDPPGKVRTAVNMKVRDDGKLEIVYDAAAIQDALGHILEDDGNVREFVAAGETLITCGDTLTSMVNERVFGIRAQVLAVLEGPFEPKFDYAAAVKNAETDHGRIIRAAGFVPDPLPKGDAPGSLRDLHVRRTSQRGTQLSVVFDAALPQTGKYNDGCELYRVVDDRDRVLLPASQTERYFNGSLEQDGARVELQFGLWYAPEDVVKLKEVVGVYRYRALGPLFAERLGQVTPRRGAMLAKHDFAITHFAHDPQSGLIEINWQALAPARLARVVLMEGNKEFISYEIEPEPLERRLIRTFKILDPNVKPPRTLDVIFYTTTKIELVEAPFVLRDVPLTRSK